jgi:uncharacterized protein YjiS (DUF1127 family)
MSSAVDNHQGALAGIPNPDAARRSWRQWFRVIWQAYRRMRVCTEQRRALLQLDDRLLDDIGVSREQAMQEGRKRFWMLSAAGRC